MSATPKVGQSVQYVGHEGTAFAAIVTMTAESYDESKDPSGTRKPADETSVSLTIFRPGGRSYSHRNVPLEGSEAHSDLVTAQAEFDKAAEAGLPEGVTAEELAESAEEAGDYTPRPVVRFWRPV